MGEKLQKKMTVEEFFEWQKRQDKNYELVDGVPTLRDDADTRSELLGYNLMCTISVNSPESFCALRRQPMTINSRVWRPDAAIISRPKVNSATGIPVVAAHLMRPEREGYDTFRRLDDYRSASAITSVLLIDCYMPQAMVWRRAAEGNWSYHEEMGLEASIDLPEIDAALPLAELYRDIEFEEA
jgi:hypothetical protein